MKRVTEYDLRERIIDALVDFDLEHGRGVKETMQLILAAIEPVTLHMIAQRINAIQEHGQ